MKGQRGAVVVLGSFMIFAASIFIMVDQTKKMNECQEKKEALVLKLEKEKESTPAAVSP